MSNRAESKRLKLTAVQQSSCSTPLANTIPPYTFTYEGSTNTDGTQFLPQRLDKAFDHWGYYNGQGGNNSSILNIPPTTVESPTGTGPFEGNANRDPNTNLMDEGILKRIDYPTGGHTIFDFEPHSYLGVETQSRDNIIPVLPSCDAPVESVCCGLQIRQWNDPITFNSTSDIASTYFVLDISRVTFAQDGTIDCAGATPRVTIRVYDISNPSTPVTVGQLSFDLTSGHTTQPSPERLITDIEVNGQSFTPNTPYRFEVESQDGRGRLYVFRQNATQNNLIAGGLRIKKITSSDGILTTDNDIIRRYEYVDPSDTSQSSGRLARFPIYGQYIDGRGVGFQTGSAGSLPTTGDIDATIFQSESIVPLGDFDGRHIGYEYVKEIYGENESDNGYQQYHFFATANSPVTSAGEYPRPPQSLNTVTGNKQQDQTYRYNNSSYQLVAQNDYVPDVTLTSSFFSNIKYKISPGYKCGTNTNQFQVYFYNVYQLPVPTQYRLGSVTSYNDGVTTITQYDYDPNQNNHLFPTAITTTNSNGVEYKTVNKYPYDIGGAVMQDLVDRNMIMPVEVEQYVGGKHVSGTKTDYAFFNDNGQKTETGSDLFPRPWQFRDYKANADGTGLNNGEGGYEVEGRVKEYWANSATGKAGYPKVFRMWDWDQDETYDWDYGLIKQRTFKDFEWNYDYYTGTRLVKSITDIDGQPVYYHYDPLMRLERVEARPKTGGGFNVVTEYDYHFTTDGLTNDYNYVRTHTDFAADPSNNSALTFQESKQFMDGLGRTFETIQKQYSPLGKDVVVVQEFDDQGRVARVSDPFEVNKTDGNYFNYLNKSGIEWTTSRYEPSPLNRVLGVTPPSWYETTTAYGSNSGEVVGYSANELSKTTVTDPNGNQSIIYKDKRGRLILSRRTDSSGNQPNDTYYTYDNKDRLITVVPPNASISNPQADLIYEYTYNEEDHMLTKKVPGADLVKMYYNDRDLLTVMEDGLLKSKNKWLVTQYDDYGRVTKTGFIDDTNFKLNLLENKAFFNDPEDQITGLLTHTFYDGTSDVQTEEITSPIYTGKVRKSLVRLMDGFEPKSDPNNVNNWLTQLMDYDAFGRVVASSGNNHLRLSNANAETSTSTYDFADNIITTTRNHLGAGSNAYNIQEQLFYDAKGRQSDIKHRINSHPLTHICNLTYDQEDQITHRNLGGYGNNNFLQSTTYDYNPQGWMKSMTANLFQMSLNYDVANPTLGVPIQKNGNISFIEWQTLGQEKRTYGFKYDYLDRLTHSYYGDYANGGLQKTDAFNTTYTYDAVGNLDVLTRNGAYWDGTDWMSDQIDDLKYSYGQGNRLTQVQDRSTVSTNQLGQACEDDIIIEEAITTNATFEARRIISANKQVSNGKNVTFEAGDRIFLKDGFKYTATSGATLQASIEDCGVPKGYGFNDRSTVAYGYDQNGNLTNDTDKGATIRYNHLNLPYEAIFATGRIEWLYDAGGTKLRKTVYENGNNQPIYTQYYLGGIEYKNDELEAIYHAEGRATEQEDGTFQYEYSIRDHLGNTRVTFADLDGDNSIAQEELLQESHYYPFGLTIDRLSESYSSSLTDYKFNGIERNEDFNLGWDMAEFRSYDAAIARWVHVDAYVHLAPNWSPYRFGFNNPVYYMDPDGLFETRDKAKDHAKQEGIRTGLFSRNKIRKQSDGTFAIENKKEHTSTSRVKDNEGNDLGVHTGVLVDAGRKTNAYTRSLAISGSYIGGMGFELGYAKDNYNSSSIFFRFSGEVGFGGSVDFLSMQELVPTNSQRPILLDDIAGEDIEYGFNVGPIGYLWGGNQTDKGSGIEAFTEYGDVFKTYGGVLGAERNSLKSWKNWKIKPKLGFEASASHGKTWFLYKNQKR